MPEAICSRGDILMCDDFEWSSDPNFVAVAADWSTHGWTLGAPLADYPENNVYGQSQLAGPPNTGNCCLQLCVHPASFTPALPDPNGTQFPDWFFGNQSGAVHARFYLKFSSSYVFGQTGGAQKIAYLRPLNTVWRTELSMSPWQTAWNTFDFSSSTCPPGGISAGDDPGHGMPGLDNRVHDQLDTQMYSYLFPGCSATQPDPRPLVKIDGNRFYCFEFRVKPNTTGQANGELGMWIDGRQIVNKTNYDFGADGVGNPLNDFWITGYYGGASPNSLSVKQYVWYDNVVVASNYIGPIGSPAPPTPPAAPTSLTARSGRIVRSLHGGRWR